MSTALLIPTPRRRHGSPADRGAADAYYGRWFSPHYYTVSGQRLDAALMTPAEIAEYRAGYDSEGDRKDWN